MDKNQKTYNDKRDNPEISNESIEIDKHIHQGMTHHGAGRLGEAATAYEKVLRIKEDHPDALYLLAGVAYQMGDPGRAGELLAEAIGCDPARDYFYTHLGLALQAMGSTKDAIGAFESAVFLNPENAETFNSLGLLLKKEGRLEEAISAFRRAAELTPGNGEVFNNLGRTFLAAKKPANALSAFQEAIRADPEKSSYYNNLGKVLCILGKMPQAIEVFKKAIEIDPSHSRAYQNLGAALEALGKMEAAAAAFETAVSLTGDAAEAHHNLGNYYLARGRYKEAITELQRSIALRPDFSEACNSLGIALKGDGRLEESVEAYKKAISINPNQAQTFNNLGVVLNALDNREAAEEAHRRAAMLDPYNAPVFQNLGLTLKSRGKLEEAARAFKRAVSIYPEYAEAYHNLGSTLNDLGKALQALEAFRKATELAPDNLSAKHMVAALSGQNPQTAPSEYIKELFDQYSSRFDKHLTEDLEYHTPVLLRQAMGKLTGEKIIFRHALDLGCGTGLAGEAFRGSVQWLTGVDISEKMIRAAREKQIYDHLETAELIEFLTETEACFDLILAADVFVYMGDLGKLFSLVRKRMAPKGFFAFSTECTDSGNFRLKPSGRFAHREIYVRGLAEKNNFQVLQVKPVLLRKENGVPIEGDIFILG